MAVVFIYRWNYALSGLNPWSYHAVNVILHAAVSALFAWLCLNCLGLSKLSSLLTASLFAIHPIHTEAVTSLNIFTLFLPFFCVGIRFDLISTSRLFTLALETDSFDRRGSVQSRAKWARE